MLPPFELLGSITAIYLLFKLVKYVKLWYSVPLDVRQFGKWALVTGSTDGIGKAYAFALAAKGLNVVLVSRNPDKLKNVADQIEKCHKVNTKIIPVDFKASDAEYIPNLREAIKGLDIGVLVNNVGMMYNYPDEFLSIKGGGEMVHNLVSVNITSVNAMTRVCLPYMLERKKGAIINIGSIGSTLPAPFVCVYAATKAYVDRFSTSLRQEYSSKGIEVQTILPGYVVTNMSPVPESITAPNADKFVKSALSQLGVYSRTSGYWGHYHIMWLSNIVPERILAYILHQIMMGVRAKKLAGKGRIIKISNE